MQYLVFDVQSGDHFIPRLVTLACSSLLPRLNLGLYLVAFFSTGRFLLLTDTPLSVCSTRDHSRATKPIDYTTARRQHTPLRLPENQVGGARYTAMSDKKKEDFELGPLGSGADSLSRGERDGFLARSPSRRAKLHASADSLGSRIHKIDNSPGASILAYCFSSISMTVVNKFVVSGQFWNLNFFYLTIQARRPVIEPHPYPTDSPRRSSVWPPSMPVKVLV